MFMYRFITKSRFTKILEAKICFLYLYSVHAARILDLSLEVVKSSQMRNETPSPSPKDFSFMPEQV